MSDEQIHTKRPTTAPLFDLLRTVPWWGVVVAIVGLVVAYSVLTDVRYVEAFRFIFDLPWNRNLIEEIPVEADTWTYTPSPKLPLQPGVYRLYVEFSRASATASEDVHLRAGPDAEAEQTDRLSKGDRVTLVKWKIIPREGLTLQKDWVHVATADGRDGWMLAPSLGRRTYEVVHTGPLHVIQVPEGAEPVPAEPIEQPSDQVLRLETSTPTLRGTVVGGSWIRLYDRYTLKQTLARAWNSAGVVLTLRASLLGYGLALVLGLIAGLMLVSRNPFALAVSKLYVEVVRGIPLLVIILYSGFVLAPYLRDATGGAIDLGGFPGAIMGLGFGYGAYLAEVFRAGIQSIHHGQMEAARSLGMSYFQAMRHVILPQAIRVVLPPLGNDFIAMLKDSSLISVIALPEILQQGRLWVSRTFRAFEGFNAVALLYLVMTLVLSLLVRLIERKAALPGRSEE